jgi:hypothetical protein
MAGLGQRPKVEDAATCRKWGSFVSIPTRFCIQLHLTDGDGNTLITRPTSISGSLTVLKEPPTYKG